MASRPPVASATLLAFLLLLLLGLEPATCRSWTRATPRVLHEPFHIDPPPAPAPAPAAPPAPEPGTPPDSSSNTPFFPLPPSYSPPAPPDQTSAGAGGTTGLPANVNGGGAQPATKAASGDNGGHHGSGKIVIAIIVCLCVIAFLGGLLFCLNRHRVRYSAHGSANWDSATGAKFTDETPLASSATTPAAHGHGHGHGHGNGRVLSPAKVVALNAGSAELLYLGTFGNRNSANSHVVEEPPKPENEAPPAPRNPNPNPNPNPNRNAAPFPASPPSPRFAPARRQRFPEAEPRPQRQLSRERNGGSSPEIHPLPPLSKKPRPAAAAAAAVAAVSAQSAPSASTDSSDEESFYSPRADSSSSGSPRTCKKRLFSPAPAPAPAPAQKSRLSFSSSESPSSSSASSTSSPAPSSPSLDSPPAAPITPKRAHPNSQNCSSSDAPQQQQSPAPPARKPPPPPPPPPFRPPTVSENNPAKVKPQSKGRTDPALQTDLPRLPVRPTPRFLSQSRSGRHSPSGSSVLPAVEIPLPPPPSRTGLFSARTGQAIEHLRPISENSVENSADSAASSDQTPKPKLKPLHWDKVRASPEKAMVWDQLKSGSFQLNEEMIETLFVYNTPQAAKTDPAKRSAANSPASLNQRLLDPKKSQNIAILLRALNVTKEEVCEALVDGTYDSIGIELLETLSKMAPSRDEELRLKEYSGDISKIGVSERFLKALLEVPFAFKRVDAMIYKANFEEDFVCINNSLQTLEAACEELRSSRLFLKLLEAVLKTGNRMNVGTARGDAQAFKLDTLLKLVDVKGTDGKTTLLHFVVQEIIKAEGARVVATTVSENNAQDQTQKDMDDDEHKKLGLQVVAGLSTELSNVKQAAGMDSEALSASVSNLARGLGKLKENLQIMMKPQQQQQSVEIQGNFFRSMSLFVEKAENDIRQIQEAAKKAFIRLRETTAYFHGDAAKEEARPLRFFMVVRDFLGILDQVCREIGRTQIKNKHRFSPSGPPPVIAHPISLPVFPRAYERRYDSSEDESSSS